MSHFLQSPYWEEMNNRLGVKTYDLQGPDWHALALVESSHGLKRLYAPYGPEVMGSVEGRPEALRRALKGLQAAGRKEGAIFVRVEPTTESDRRDGSVADTLRQLGYRQVRDVQPSNTWVLDLTQDEEALMKGIGSTNRNLYRGIERAGMTITESTDVSDVLYLSDFLQKIAGNKDNFLPHTAEYLTDQAAGLFDQKAARLFLVWHSDRVIAASYVYDGDGARYYAHAGADPEYRRLRAGQRLLSHMIFDAKARGMREFDFYGIAPDDDPNHPWAGFTKFKKSFGGFVRQYHGTWENSLSPLRYALYGQASRAYRRFARRG